MVHTHPQSSSNRTGAGLMSRRGFLAAAGGTAIGAGVGLAGCGRSEAHTPKSSGPVDLQVWTNDPNYPAYFNYWAKKLNNQPDSRFDYRISSLIQSTDQVVTKLLTSYMSGTRLPDMPGFEISQFSRLQRDDIGGQFAVDLRKEIPNLDRDFYKARIVPYSSGDAVYGLDSDMCMGVYYYREDLWEKYGLSTDFETWDDLLAIGAKAHRDHNVAVAAISSNDITWMTMLMLQQGGQCFGTDGSLQVDNPHTVDALKLLRRGIKSGAFLDLSNFYGAAGVAAMNAGQVIGYLMPDWFLPFVLQLNAPKLSGTWRIRPFPRFATGHATAVWGGTGFGVTKNQPGTTAALDLLKQAYCTREGQVQRFLKASYLPTMKDAWQDARLRKYESKYLGGQRPFDVYGRIVDDTPTMVTSPYWDVMNARMTIALSETMRGIQSPERAVRDAADSIRSQMTQ